MSDPMMPSISVCLNSTSDEQGNTIFVLKIQEQSWELNIWMAKNELDLIPDVRTANWNQRISVQIGKCAGLPTFWSCEDGILSILIGQNDESWDFGVTMPEAVIDNMITESKTTRE
jgi:hypothetical protein